MKYQEYKGNSFNLYTIKTDKFKNCQIEVIFRNNVKKEDITKRIFLSYILTEATKKYNTHKLYKERCEDLYNLYLFVQNNKIGKTIHTTFKADFLNPKYAMDDLLTDVIKMLREVILNPNVINDAFDKTTFDIVKNDMIDEIKSEKDSPMRHAILKLIENIDEDSALNIRIDGYLEDLELITPESLYKYYKEFIANDLCDVFVIGALNMDEVNDKFRKIFDLSSIKTNKFIYTEELKTRKKIIEVNEETKLKQSRLVVGCNLINLNDYERNIVMFLLNIILGGGNLDSKLYQNLRQKNALCYSCSSMYQKNNSLIIITTSIDAKNYKKAVRLIKKSILDLKKGNISKNEIIDAKRNIIESLDMNSDIADALLANYIFHIYLDMPLIDERKVEFQKVTKKDLINVAKKIKLNTIFLLKDGGYNEKNNSK